MLHRKGKLTCPMSSMDHGRRSATRARPGNAQSSSTGTKYTSILAGNVAAWLIHCRTSRTQLASRFPSSTSPPTIQSLKFLRVTIIQCEWQAFVNTLLVTSAIAFLAIVEPNYYFSHTPALGPLKCTLPSRCENAVAAWNQAEDCF